MRSASLQTEEETLACGVVAWKTTMIETKNDRPGLSQRPSEDPKSPETKTNDCQQHRLLPQSHSLQEMVKD